MNSASPVVNIALQPQQSALSKPQKLFNKLIKKIEDERKRLRAWQETIPAYQAKYTSEFAPLLQTYFSLKVEIVYLYDKAYDEKGFTKSEKVKLKDVICILAAELVAEGDNEKLKQIYNKYTEGDFDAEVAEEQNAVKAMMEEMLGIDLGDDAGSLSQEELMAHVAEKMQAQFAETEQAQQKHKERFEQRKKSAKTLAKEAKQQAEVQNISQSIREVYRKLASALHPDRELDALERERKTALMQRVNTAYDSKDLLTLLELQLEVEQIDQATINTLSEDRLKYYNKILTEQSAEILQEVSDIEMSFKMRFNIPPNIKLAPTTAMRSLAINIKDIEKDIKGLKTDLIYFQNIKNIKQSLKAYQIQPDHFYQEDLFHDLQFS